LSELALGEGASQKLVSNSINILVLEEEDLVHLEIGETRLVEVCKSFLDSSVGLSLNLLIVELLRRLGINAKDALREKIAWLASDLALFIGTGRDHHLLIFVLEVALGLLHLLVSSDFDLVLCYHLNWLIDLLSNSWLFLDVVKGRDFLLGSSSNWVDAEDVTADLVAELNAASLKAEECRVATLLLRRLALNREFEGLAGSDLVAKSDDLGLHVITAGLDQLSALRPCDLTIIAHPPRLAEDITADDLMLVREALFDKTSRVAGLFLRGSSLRTLALPGMVVKINMVVLRASSSSGRSNTALGKVLADQLMRSLTMLADLDKWVLVVLNLAGANLTEISISLHRAHVTDTLDRIGFTAITDDAVMDLLSLPSLSLFDMLSKELLKARVAVIFNLLADKGSHSGKLTAHKSASTVALAAWKALFIHLCSIALDASDLFDALHVILIRRNE